MKRVLSLILALLLVFSLAACGTAEAPTEPSEDPVTEPVTEPTEAGVQIAPGTSWNAVADFHQEEDAESVWQYYFFDPQDSSYNLMQVFVDHEPDDIHSWYPWESSWVGVGFNNGEFCNTYGPGLEQNADGPNGMMSVIGFIAPADGDYVVTGKLMNAFDQNPDLYTVVKEDGTVVTTKDFREYISGGYTFLTPTMVTLKAGEKLYFQCASTSDWVSTYTDITVYYAPVDESVMAEPESYMPEIEVEPDPAVEGAVYTATAEFSSENNDGVWVYASTFDGLTYELTASYDEPDWTGDGQPDAAQWYSASGTGMGFNYDAGMAWLELNVSETPENGGEITALGFKAPEDGTYHLTIFTKNFWGQSSNGVVVHQNGEDIATIPFEAASTQQTIDVTMTAGEVVYIHGTSAGGWVSAYVAAFVTVG